MSLLNIIAAARRRAGEEPDPDPETGPLSDQAAINWAIVGVAGDTVAAGTFEDEAAITWTITGSVTDP